jgi:hypothetical protein
MRVARYYCPDAHTTFSLLPDCLAARIPGDLDAVAHVVRTVEAARSVEAAADLLRPGIDLTAAVRWFRRRLGPTRAALLAVVTLLPGLTGVCGPTLKEVESRLGAPVLRRVRAEAEKHLRALAAPVGFRPRGRGGVAVRTARQQDMGPDPPSKFP